MGVHKGVHTSYTKKHLTIPYQRWQEAFDRFDGDRSGTIDRAELQNALTYFGYIVTPQLLNILQRKYGLYH